MFSQPPLLHMHQHDRALVTGASSGLGAAIARRLAARGLEVWLAARREAELEKLAIEIRDGGGRAQVVRIDLARPDETHDRLARLDRDTGGIDLVVANGAIAGIPAATPISKATWDEVRAILEVNLTGTIASLMAFVPGMVARNHGHLVGISSLTADAPAHRVAAYGATKAGLSYFLEAAGIELRHRGIAVTDVRPGFMRTPAAEGVREPMPFLIDADHAARVIDRSILRRKRLLRFPLATSLLMRAPYLLPAPIREPLLRHLYRER